MNPIVIAAERSAIISIVQTAATLPVPAAATLQSKRYELMRQMNVLHHKCGQLVWKSNRMVMLNRAAQLTPPNVKSYVFRATSPVVAVVTSAFGDLEQAVRGLETELRTTPFAPSRAYAHSYAILSLLEQIFKVAYGAIQFALLAWEVDPESDEQSKIAPGPGKVPSVVVRRSNGPLFARQPGDARAITVTDPHQGQIGDCYFVATMAAVAHTDPGLIRSRIKSNGDGTYDVTLKSWLLGNDEVVTVSDHIYTNVINGRPTYAQGNPAGGTNEIWPSVLERAYAKWRGGYDTASNSEGWRASIEAAMERFGPAETLNASSPADALRILTEAQAKGWPVVLSTREWSEPGDWAASVRYWLTDLDDATRATRQATATRTGTPTDHHAYIFVEVKGGMIHILNPWGIRSPKPMPPADFHRLFDDIVVGKF